MDFFINLNNIILDLKNQLLIEEMLSNVSQLAAGSGYKSLTLNLDSSGVMYFISIELESDIEKLESQIKQGVDFNHTLSIAVEDIKNKILTSFVLSAS